MSARDLSSAPDDALLAGLHAGLGEAPESELLAAADTLARIDGCRDLTALASRPVATSPTAGVASLHRPGLAAAPAGPDGALLIVVYGTPAGQGRISFYGKGRAKHSNADALLPWRQSIATAAKRASGCHEYAQWGSLKFCAVCRVPSKDHGLLASVPVGVDLTVTVEKPKSAPKRTRTYPITRYSTDADHHARACLDALSASGLLHDDAQVVDLRTRKVYPGEHEFALDRPGARIVVWQIGGAP